MMGGIEMKVKKKINLKMIGHISKTFNLLWKAAPGYFFICVLLNIAIGVFSPLSSLIWKNILDSLTNILAKKITIDIFIFWMSIYFCIQFFQQIFTLILDYYQVIFSEYVDIYIKKNILSQVAKFELAKFDDNKIHDEISKANQESTTRSLQTLTTILLIIQNIFSAIGTIFLVISFSFNIVIFVFISVIPLFILNIKIYNKLFNIYNKRFEKLRLSKSLQNLFIKPENIKEIKVYKISDFLIDSILNIHKEVIKEDKKIRSKITIQGIFINFISLFLNFAIKILIVLKGISNSLTIGLITMYITSVDNLSTSISALLTQASNMYQNTLYMQSIFRLMEIKNPKNGEERLKSNFKKIEFKDVSFRYPGSDRETISHLNLTLNSEMTYALVGKNGAGKTTLIKLLLKLYNPTEGQILIDGVNLQNIDTDDYYERISAVFQDYVKYPFDIYTNIGIGNIEKISNEKLVKQSAKKAGIHEYIDNLPNKYNSQLLREWKNSTDISQGQWQKLAIARAFMKNPEIIILDEPTASMDAISEYDTFSSFKRLKHKKLCLLVTHRLSNIKLADQIIVLDKGKLTEQGSHKELINKKGIYYELYQLQSKLYKNQEEKRC